jgi:hypothetical protein
MKNCSVVLVRILNSGRLCVSWFDEERPYTSKMIIEPRLMAAEKEMPTSTMPIDDWEYLIDVLIIIDYLRKSQLLFVNRSRIIL